MICLGELERLAVGVFAVREGKGVSSTDGCERMMLMTEKLIIVL